MQIGLAKLRHEEHTQCRSRTRGENVRWCKYALTYSASSAREINGGAKSREYMYISGLMLLLYILTSARVCLMRGSMRIEWIPTFEDIYS